MTGGWSLCVAIVLAFALFGDNVQGQAQSFGTGDISRYLNDQGFVQKQISCVLGEGGCDNFGNQLKLAIPEVIGRNCRSCNANQATNARRLIGFIQARYPDAYSRIVARYRG